MAFPKGKNRCTAAPRPQMDVMEVYRCGAEKGYPDDLFHYAVERYDQGNRGEAFVLCRRAAEAGEPRAFFWAGYSYELGEGVPKDAARAAQYYQQALSAPIQEKVNPANRLGMFCYDGRGVEQDYAKAFAYLDRIDWNCHPGFYLLGKMYCSGLGVPMDIAKGGWNTSGRPATIPMPRRSCGTTKRRSLASGSGDKTAAAERGEADDGKSPVPLGQSQQSALHPLPR